MITCPDKPERPPDRPCAGACGLAIAPVFIEPIEIFGKIAGFTNRWVFEYETCPACADKHARARADAERADRIKSRETALVEMVFEKGFREFTFERYTVTAGTATAVGACKAFDPSKSNLYLWGTAGCGKSHLAVATFRRFHMDGVYSVFTKHSALNRSMQGLKSDEYDRKMDDYAGARVLLIDDLGTAKQTEYADQVLYDIIDTRQMRYQNGLIITSNLSLADLARKFGDDRLPSRIAGFCDVIKMDGADWRVKRG